MRKKAKTSELFIFLEHTAKEVDKLLTITREYSVEQNNKDQKHLVGDAKLANLMALSNITLKLSHTKLWLKQVRSTLELEKSQNNSTHIYPQLHVLHDAVTQDEPLYGYLPHILVLLSRASARIYTRMVRLNQQIHGAQTYISPSIIEDQAKWGNVVLFPAAWYEPKSALGNASIAC